ncbi:hypothetical protein DAPPUDRAFT_94770 [Daphnia pulex]|uniref:Uncharacterized protein n=1 Tax=Daphnia pulex TaxID=6669 RepID=E9FT06_DAPPU|nr:hypothetical protein DAPPUDRAFT_94769 [Daphnia pulex]EFX89728.1 hypothetical protein DAPPUDRAFT_94770 [Daphnia pulex]|eukprot:EFX89287.1 hypothetical protein DAPPUDRAFT_94769 [Daphnia pulex]
MKNPPPQHHSTSQQTKSSRLRWPLMIGEQHRNVTALSGSGRIVYVQVGDPFACLSNNSGSQQSLSFIAVLQMVSWQPPGEKGVQSLNYMFLNLHTRLYEKSCRLKKKDDG